MTIRFRSVRLAAVLAVPLLVATACGSSKSPSASAPGNTTLNRVGGSMEVAAVWSAQEQANFQQVLAAFTAQTGTQVTFTSTGNDIATVLGTRIQGGSPPDVAVLPQPGLLKSLVSQNALQPIDALVGQAVTANWSQDWKSLGSVNGQLYGLFYKGANKSLGWYNVHAFTNAGVTAPATFNDVLTAAQTIRASGVPPYAIGGGDGWVLTDLFENIYLRQAGTAKYDALTNHTIPWTDPSVKTALTTMGQILSDKSLIAGGSATQITFQQAVDQVFKNPPSAAMLFEGDFVPGSATQKLQPVTDYNSFPFPSINGSVPSVVGGGDAVVMMKNTPQAQELVKFLATPAAAEIWAKLGGFSSPNKAVNASVYPDPVTQSNATALAEATTFRFDMSDQAPVAFGGTPAQGEWLLLQQFANNPTNVDGIASQLEQAAAAAYGA